MADGECVASPSWSPSGSAVSTHSASASDSEHESSYASSSLGDFRPPPKKKGKSMGTGKFRSSWRLPPHITASSKGSRFAFCKVCTSNFCISHGGLNDIKRHVDGPVHKRKLTEMDRNQRIDGFISDIGKAHAKKVTSAELMMSQFIAAHNLPFQAADHLSDLFASMFPDSTIAADFRCKYTKAKAIICDALDPHLKEPVLELAKAAPFNLLCDESNERGDHVKLLTVLVRLYDPAGGMVVTRHVDTVEITDLSAEGIFTALKTALEVRQIPFSNLMSFTSDTCNVMKGKKNGVIAKLRTLQPRIIDIDCVCHLVSLCVKTATKQLPLKVDELLVDIYYHFWYSVKRVTSLQEYADFCTIEYKTISKHCETRWLSLRKSIQRTIHMWDPLCSYFQSHCDVEKPGKVRTINGILQQPPNKTVVMFLIK